MNDLATTTSQEEVDKPQDLETYQLWRSKVGRPNKITKYVTAKLVKAIRKGSTIKDACSIANIDQSTFYRFNKLNKEFATQIEESLVFFKKKHIENIDTASRKDPANSRWLLERRFPNEYAPRTAISLSQRGEIKIIVSPSGYNPDLKQPSVFDAKEIK